MEVTAKYYREQDGSVWVLALDGSQDDSITETMVQMPEDEIWLHMNPPPNHEQIAVQEDQWREVQMARIANQLLMIEDEDPEAEPGTKRQWQDYRIALRKWSADKPDFPDSSKRPVAPS